MSDSDAFVVSIAQNADPADALRRAVKDSGVDSAHVQDVVFGSSIAPNLKETLTAAGLDCPSAVVSSGMRAVLFAAQSILSGDLELALAAGLDGEVCIAMVLAAPEAVGRWNLLPRGRLAGRSLSGPDAALSAAELSSADVAVSKSGENGVALIKDVLEELESRSAQWGLVAEGDVTLLIERI